MVCSGLNVYNRPCGISTKNKYCHIHIAKYTKIDKDDKLSHRVVEQKKALHILNQQLDSARVTIKKERSMKSKAVLENERMKREIEMLKDRNRHLEEKTFKLKQENKDKRLANKELTNKVIEMNDQVDQLESMRDDYEAYQTIRCFEGIHNHLMKIYNQTNSYGVIRAMKRSPKEAEELLGNSPWKKYTKLKVERNALAHAI